MSDLAHVTSNSASDFRRDSAVDHEVSDTAPHHTRNRRQQGETRQQSQSQSQPQSQTTITPEHSTRKSRQRSKSSSPEKYKPVLRSPSLRLYPLRQYVDSTNTPGRNRSLTTNSKRPRYLAAPIQIRNGNDGGLNTQTDEIEKRSGRSRFPGQGPHSSFDHGHARLRNPTQSPPLFGHDPSHRWTQTNSRAAVSPDISPTNVSIDLNHGSAATSPICDEGSEESESSPFPHYASFFRPRFPPVDDSLAILQPPIPTFNSVGQALAIKEALTAFHMGVVLVDEWAGENQYAWCEGLRSVVDENMPGLRDLGVRAHQIVFYYHGRGDSTVGNDVWDEIIAWQRREQDQMRREEFWHAGFGYSHQHEVIWNDTQEEPERRQLESSQQEEIKQKEAEREKIRRSSKQAKKKVRKELAKQEALKSLVVDGTSSGPGRIYEDGENGSKKAT